MALNGFPFIRIDPASGKVIAEVTTGTVHDYEECVQVATDAFKTWKNIPAPQRGEIVREIGHELRKNLQPLGKLVSLGKSFRDNTQIISIC